MLLNNDYLKLHNSIFPSFFVSNRQSKYFSAFRLAFFPISADNFGLLMNSRVFEVKSTGSSEDRRPIL